MPTPSNHHALPCSRPRVRARLHRPRSLALAGPLLATAALLAAPDEAHAGEPERDGAQVDILVGGSACVPARGDCSFEDDRLTKGSAGLAFDLGWRAHRAFFLGAGYTIGWFTPTWELGPMDRREYRNAFSQGVFAVLRAYIPIWRIDIGLELSPGWTQATFVAEGSQIRQISHGFALRPGVSLDFRLGRHLFLGGRLDFIANFHTRFCTKDGDRDCSFAPTIDQLPVHQVIGGIHFGANF